MDSTFTGVVRQLCQAKLIRCPDLLLLLLTNHRHGGWLIKDVVSLLGLPTTTITMAKNKLVREGLVAEHLPHRDQRTVKLYLTLKGEVKACLLWKSVRELSRIEKPWRKSNPPVGA